MPSPAAYAALLDRVCRRLSAGSAPWAAAVARHGPPHFADGTPLRGLAAVLAWHVADERADHPLVWANAGDDDDPPLIASMPGRGGEVLRGFVPFRYRIAVRDPVPQGIAPLATESALHRHLPDALRAVAVDDQKYVVWIARALLATAADGPSSRTGRVEGPWDQTRLCRVAAWGQWLADAVLSASLPSFEAPTRSAWLLAALPPEVVRDPLYSDELGLPAPEGLWGALGRRAGRPVSRASGTELATWQSMADGARGHLLAQTLVGGPQACEAGTAWRRVGTCVRERIASGQQVAELISTVASMKPEAVVALRRQRDRHRATSWFHPGSSLRLGELKNDGARGWAEAVGLSLDTPVSNLDPVQLATLRRTRVGDDRDLLAHLARALHCPPNWRAVLERAAEEPWERQKRPKRSGGIRWLDVPSPALAHALRPIARVLAALLPANRTVTAFHSGASPALHARAHAGAKAAVKADISDFFGTVRPRHLRPWLGFGAAVPYALRAWSDEAREAVLELVFKRRDGVSYLPQGSPPSPPAANLAGLWVDRALTRAAVGAFGRGNFTYTRYADDLVLSCAGEPPPDFCERALGLLRDAVQGQGFALRASKSRMWRAEDPEPLRLCGLWVPRSPDEPVRLDRDTWRRARAALHSLRQRRGADMDDEHAPPMAPANGLLAYAYSATGDLRWLAYTSYGIADLARALAGEVYAEAFLAGWSDP
jgi:hypothetical protein